MASSDTSRLFNKYRPTNFSEVTGQKIAVSYLQGLIKNGNYRYVNEIILYSSVGGVSKTTLARIYAKAIFCENPTEGEPCNSCASCLAFNAGKYPDYLEYDGAEYNTVDSVAPIIELARTYPYKNNKYRVIVLNELQRASKQAMTKFLDHLEFGQNRTIFIFTTTEINSIIQPLRSRCFNIEIQPMEPKDIKNILLSICDRELISYSEDVLTRIVEGSGGSVREAIRTMDLVNLSYGSVNNFYTSSNSYDKIVNILASACLPSFNNYESVCSIVTNDLYRDICRSIIDMENYISDNTLRWVNKSSAKHVAKILEPEIPRISEAIIKYKPQNHEDFFLLCKTFCNTKSSAKQVTRPATGRRFINEVETKQEDIFTKFGFVKVQ